MSFFETLISRLPEPSQKRVKKGISWLSDLLIIQAVLSFITGRDIVRDAAVYAISNTPQWLSTLLKWLGHGLSYIVSIWHLVSHSVIIALNKLIGLSLPLWSFDALLIISAIIRFCISIVQYRSRNSSNMRKFEIAVNDYLSNTGDNRKARELDQAELEALSIELAGYVTADTRKSRISYGSGLEYRVEYGMLIRKLKFGLMTTIPVLILAAADLIYMNIRY